MTFTVEIRLAGADLAGFMTRSRTWLDHRHCEPGGFREAKTGAGLILQVDFQSTNDAADFAQAFGGRVTGLPNPRANPPLAAVEDPSGPDAILPPMPSSPRCHPPKMTKCR